MRVRVDEIPESGRTLRFHWDEERLRQFVPPGDPFQPKLVRPVNVVLYIVRNPDHIRVTGKIAGSLEVACHRCLQPFPFALEEEVDVYLIEESRAPEDEEKELEDEEIAYEFFDGEAIDIDQLVAEQIFLALPVKVLCSEDCKGICPRCGVNLNEEACRCGDDAKDSPFAKLHSLKGDLPKTGDR
ncbi:MAG: DUF177 domain-containing protein [Desulfobacteraceae bacterium]|nr:DUF177 domain-containing protein [Desulfobacteraceae bacterium]